MLGVNVSITICGNVEGIINKRKWKNRGVKGEESLKRKQINMTQKERQGQLNSETGNRGISVCTHREQGEKYTGSTILK